MSGHDPILQVKGVTFGYPGKKDLVLDGLDFSLCRGDKVGLVGPNGSGKSTLLHLVMGLLPPAHGEIHLFQKKIETEEDFRAARKKTGFLFQNADDQLFSPTVLEDVAFGPLNLGKSVEEAREMSLAMLDSIGLGAFADRITYKLSGGEKKLVSLATVLVMEPQLLILDEPTTGLDPETMAHIIDILNRLDISFLVVSHQYGFLSRVTSDIYRMQQGTVCMTFPATLFIGSNGSRKSMITLRLVITRIMTMMSKGIRMGIMRRCIPVKGMTIIMIITTPMANMITAMIATMMNCTISICTDMFFIIAIRMRMTGCAAH